MTSIVMVGVHEDAAPADTAARFVGVAATRRFTKGPIPAQDLIKLITKACAETWAVGMTAVWSFKPLPADVASGAWKRHVRALGAFLRINPHFRTIVVIWHEPENDVPKWFKNAEAFVKLYNTVAGWLEDTYPDVLHCHAAMGYRYADGVDITDTVAPRWRTKARINAGDFYSGRSFPLGRILPELSGFVRWRKYVAGEEYAVTERGWAASLEEGALRAATIRRETAWLVKNRPVLYLVWATPGSEGDPGLLLDAAAEAAVDDLIVALNIPRGYVAGPVEGLLIHEATGIAVAVDHVDVHDAYCRALGSKA